MNLGDGYVHAAENAALGSTHHSEFPSTCYAALYDDSSPPSSAGGGTELTALGRVAVQNDGPHWAPASGGQKTNALDITGFNTVGADQPAAGYWVLHGHPTNDDVFLFGQLADPITVHAGESGFIPAGSITVTAG